MTENFYSLLAGRLRQARALKGWSQDELGRRAGISVFKVNRTERGSRRVTIADLIAISTATNLPLTWFLSNDEQTPPIPQGQRPRGDLPAEALDEILGFIQDVKARYRIR